MSKQDENPLKDEPASWFFRFMAAVMMIVGMTALAAAIARFESLTPETTFLLALFGALALLLGVVWYQDEAGMLNRNKQRAMLRALFPERFPADTNKNDAAKR